MRINIDDTDLNDDLAYLYEGDLYTGEMIETAPSGQVIELMTVRRGTKHGPQRSWYTDGVLKAEEELVNGLAVGTSRQWHANGQLAEERHFDHRGRLRSIDRWTADGSRIEPEPPR